MSLTQAQRRLIELDAQKEAVKKYYESLTEVLKTITEEIGVDGFFQDPGTGTVYQVNEPAGRFIQYERYSYARTKQAGETRGTLSLKKAQEAGFDL